MSKLVHAPFRDFRVVCVQKAASAPFASRKSTVRQGDHLPIDIDRNQRLTPYGLPIGGGTISKQNSGRRIRGLFCHAYDIERSRRQTTCVWCIR